MTRSALLSCCSEYPHGVFPMSQLVAISLTDMAWPGHKIYSLAASSVFNVPFWRHCMTWLGARPATERNFKRLIKMGSVGLVPGQLSCLLNIYYAWNTMISHTLSSRTDRGRMCMCIGTLPQYCMPAASRARLKFVNHKTRTKAGSCKRVTFCNACRTCGKLQSLVCSLRSGSNRPEHGNRIQVEF